jgi:hypothetical protein
MGFVSCDSAENDHSQGTAPGMTANHGKIGGCIDGKIIGAYILTMHNLSPDVNQNGLMYICMPRHHII